MKPGYYLFCNSPKASKSLFRGLYFFKTKHYLSSIVDTTEAQILSLQHPGFDAEGEALVENTHVSADNLGVA